MKKNFKVIQFNAEGLPKEQVKQVEESIKEKFNAIGVKNIVVIPFGINHGNLIIDEYKY